MLKESDSASVGGCGAMCNVKDASKLENGMGIVMKLCGMNCLGVVSDARRSGGLLRMSGG